MTKTCPDCHATVLSTSQPERVGIKPEALTALKGYTQADEDGVMVNVSRQALDEAIAALAAAPDRYTVDDPWHRPATPGGTQGALALYLNEVQPVDGRVQLINISLDELSVLRRLIAATPAVGGLALGWLERCLKSDPLSEPERFEIERVIETLRGTPAVGGERVSFRRQWLQTCYYQMANMKLPPGYVGDWLFLFREQIKDALDKPAQPAYLCSDCPPAGYPTDETRCLPCPRRFVGTSDGETKA